jgi:hypothetical protein
MLRLGQAPKDLIGHWKEGVSLERDSGSTIEQLCLAVAAGRWLLAYDFRRHGNALLTRTPPLFRSVISRYYYAMYHALRAASYIHTPGDDHEKHSVLPRNIPADFPNRDAWSNQLKSAREFRNQADYNPLPQGAATWRDLALTIRPHVDELLPVAKTYLTSKGCLL